MVNKIKYILLLIIIVFGTKLTIVNAHKFDNKIKLYDYAIVLSDKEKSKLKEKIDKYIDDNDIDLAIVLVKYYNFKSLKEYSKEFYLKNDFGIDYNNKGIILVIDTKENNIDIQINGNIDLYTDNEISSIIESVNKKEKYYDKINIFMEYLNKYIHTDYKSIDKDKKNNLLYIFISLIISLVVSSIVVLLLLLKVKNKKSIVTKKYTNIIKLNINKTEDKYVTTNTKMN